MDQWANSSLFLPPLGALFGMGPSDELAGEKEKKEDI